MKIYFFHFHYPIELWTFLSPIVKPYYCGVLYVAIITDPAGTMVESVHDKQKVVGSNPYLSKQFFFTVSRVPAVENHKTGGRVWFKGGYRV